MENRKFSFFAKKPIACFVCGYDVYREEMLTGRGRLSAGDLSEELRRTYKPIPELGHITPIMYSVTTCPYCFVSFLNSDWQNMDQNVGLDQKSRTVLLQEKDKRTNLLHSIFKEDMDFGQPKNQITAAASYYLALSSYPVLPPKFSPKSKCATVIMRFSWLLDDIMDLYPENSTYWQNIKKQLEPKIYDYLDIVYQSIIHNTEPNVFFGPDTDRNNGFDGIVYLRHYYKLRLLPKDNLILRQKTFQEVKSDLSRIFGLGKSSKSRPVAILDLVRGLYEQARDELNKITPMDDNF